ncbi:MAG: sigma-70 family RNA polymerase sigma factor [Gemmataceae bacterium]
MSAPGEITLLLQQANQGNTDAADQLFRLVERELRAIAAKRKQQLCQDVTLTGLVDEAFCKLVGQDQTQWQSGDRKKFFSYAATKIHNLLINELKARNTEKRGGEYNRVDLEVADADASDKTDEYPTMLLDLQTALDEMPGEAEFEKNVFRIRYFLGCTVEETADILGVTESEVKQSSQRVRSWLKWKMKSYDQDTSL